MLTVVLILLTIVLTPIAIAIVVAFFKTAFGEFLGGVIMLGITLFFLHAIGEI